MVDEISEFTVNIPQGDVDRLRDRLRTTTLADDFANDDGAYGLRRPWLADMIEYWADGFDWRAQESAMNAFPHFRTRIDGIPVHFMHIRGTGERRIPIVLTHGWPWTFWDWKDVIGPLTDPRSHGIDSPISFDVVVPSVPGFGFSSPLRRPVGCRDVARLWDSLMHEGLGYDHYVAAGGDWGGKVTGEIGFLFPDRVIGAYSTLQAIAGSTPSLDGANRFAPDEQWMADQMAAARPFVTSHLEVHRRDPQTLSYALSDSPAGMAAWIWERRMSWRDPGTLDDVAADRDFLCTTASLFWHTGTIGTSMRFYRDNFGDRIAPRPDGPTARTPFGFGITPRDVLYMPRAEAAAQVNLQHWSTLSRGGHFSAYEVPDELSADIHAFVTGLL